MFLVLLLVLLFSPLAHAQEAAKYVPPDFGGVDFARQYGVACNGKDETAKLRQGLQEARSNLELGGKHYALLPPGDCVASDRLEWRDAAGAWQQQLVFAGSGRGRTRLHLAASSPGYGSATTPKALLYTASLSTQGCGIRPEGAGACGFFNGLRDLTVRVEAGNPGAIGIDFLANNVGMIRDAEFVAADATTGAQAIGTARYGPGPAIVEDVTIRGFKDPVGFSAPEYSMVLNNLTLENWSRYGIVTASTALSIRGLKATSNRKIAFHSSANNGLAWISDSTFTNTNPNAQAWALEGPGHLIARGLTSQGYASVIGDNLGVAVPGTKVREYVSSAPVSAYTDDPRKTLNIPVPPTPIPFWSNEPADWVNVADFLADPNSATEDWDAAIRAAFATCKPMVYVPSDKIVRRSPMQPSIQPPPCVRTFIGFNATWRPPAGIVIDPNAIQPTFEVTAASAEPFSALMIVGRSGGFSGIRQNSQRPIVVQDSSIGKLVQEPDTAPVWLSDVIAFPTVRAGAALYAAQLNMEGPGPLLTVDGGTAVLLGGKTEVPSIVARVTNGGRLEWLGGLLYPLKFNAATQAQTPAFDVIDGAASVSYIEAANGQSGIFAYIDHVRETRNGVTAAVNKSALIVRPSTFGHIVPLISAQGRATCVAP